MIEATALDPTLSTVARHAATDEATLALILVGSRAGGSAAASDDYDFLRIVPDGTPADAPDWPEVENVCVVSLELQELALLAETRGWWSYGLAGYRLLVDKTGGEIEPVLSRLRPNAAEAAAAAGEAYEAYLHSFVRSLRSQARSDPVGARLHACESVRHLAAALFALEGRHAPYPDKLSGEIGTLSATQGWEPGFLEQQLLLVTSAADADAQRRLQVRVERLMEKRGLGNHERWRSRIDALSSPQGSSAGNAGGSSAAVLVDGVTRVFTSRKGHTVTALDGVSLELPVGEVHGLLGPNGAGKTTLVKILSTVLLPSGGRALVCGHDVVSETAAVRHLIGIVFGGERGLYTRLSARQNLEYWGALYKLSGREIKERSAALLERVGLAERADQRVEQFSRGMKQRLHLARGLIGDPKVLFLDEPTTGMDPLAAREFRNLIAELRAEGRTILLTTHDMVEAETVCDRVSLIDRGRALATETPRSLSALISRFQRVDAEDVPAHVLGVLERLPGVAAVVPQGDGTVRVETNAEGAVAHVLAQLVDAGVTSVKTSLPSLEEVYVHVIGDRGLTV